MVKIKILICKSHLRVQFSAEKSKKFDESFLSHPDN